MVSLRELLIAIVFLLTMQISAVVLGNNNYFLPGDAFFSSAITSSTLDADGDTGDIELAYIRGSVDDSQFSGYAGYTTLIISGDTTKLRSSLRKRLTIGSGDANESTAEPAEPEKLPRLRILVYRRTFDFKRYHLGITNNEKWMDEVKVFGHSGSIRLCPFVSSREGVVESWRNAEAVDPLGVEIPDVPITRGQAIDVPLRINANDVSVVVLGTEAQYAERKEKIRLMNSAFRRGVNIGGTDDMTLLELRSEK